MQVMAILLLFIIGPTLIVIGFLIGIFAEFRRPIDFLPCAGIAVFGVGLIYVSVKMYRVDRGSED